MYIGPIVPEQPISVAPRHAPPRARVRARTPIASTFNAWCVMVLFGAAALAMLPLTAMFFAYAGLAIMVQRAGRRGR